MECRVHCIIVNSLLIRKAVIKHWLTRSVSLSHKIVGEGISDPDKPPVFLLHDLISNKSHWMGIGKTIVNVTKRTVVAVDLRNHGYSPHTSSHKYEELATDVLQLLQKLNVERASLIGHGVGGRTAMCLSLMAPQKVSGILIVDISPISTCTELKVSFLKILEALKTVKFKEQKKVYKARKDAKTQLKHLIDDDVIMKVLLSNINETHGGTIGWTCNIDVLIKHFKYIASFPKKFKSKTYPGTALFIGGQLSEFLPPDDLTGIREIFPQAVVKYVPKTGHNLHVDNPKAFMELAIAFIKRNN